MANVAQCGSVDDAKHHRISNMDSLLPEASENSPGTISLMDQRLRRPTDGPYVSKAQQTAAASTPQVPTTCYASRCHARPPVGEPTCEVEGRALGRPEVLEWDTRRDMGDAMASRTLYMQHDQFSVLPCMHSRPCAQPADSIAPVIRRTAQAPAEFFGIETPTPRGQSQPAVSDSRCSGPPRVKQDRRLHQCTGARPPRDVPRHDADWESVDIQASCDGKQTEPRMCDRSGSSSFPRAHAHEPSELHVTGRRPRRRTTIHELAASAALESWPAPERRTSGPHGSRVARGDEAPLLNASRHPNASHVEC